MWIGLSIALALSCVVIAWVAWTYRQAHAFACRHIQSLSVMIYARDVALERARQELRSRGVGFFFVDESAMGVDN